MNESLIKLIVNRLAEIEGIQAIALGGSVARGTTYGDSDIDLGLYYNPTLPPSIEELNILASELDDNHGPNLITELGEWGPWVNGGGWLKINKYPVDWLYRDIELVSKVITKCQSGQTNCYYYPAHPHGFHDYYYLSEIYYCRLLYDPQNILLAFKERVRNYPQLLKKTIIEKYLWENDFSLKASLKAAKRNDVFYVTGCLFRCVACLLQVLFAFNERYFINEKGAVQMTDSFVQCPRNFKEIVCGVLGNPGSNEGELLTSIKTIESITEEVKNYLYHS